MNEEPTQSPNNTPLASEYATPAQLDSWSPLAEAMRPHPGSAVSKNGNPIDPPDTGSPMSRLLAIFITIAVVATVVFWQNTPDDTKQRLFFGGSNVELAPNPESPAAGNFAGVDLMGRLYLRMYEMMKSQPIMEQLDPPGSVQSIEDQVRLVMLAGEFEGSEQALDRLNALRDEAMGAETDGDSISFDVSSDDLVLREINALETLYTRGGDALEPEQAQQLKDRYGYIAMVALTHGLPDTDPARAALIDGFWPVMLFMIFIVLLVILAPLLGLVLLVVGCVRFLTGQMPMRARVPTPGGSVYLETYAVFVSGFLLMAIGTFIVSNSKMPELAAFSLLAQWLLLLSVFWALLRGVKGHDWKNAIGWHTGQGVLKEIGCGVAGYLAALPLYIAGVLITAILLILKEMLTKGSGDSAPEAISNPIFEIIANGDLFFILLLFLLATTWAPIVEESIFRGALYRHLRGRLNWVGAGLLSALLFAFMHDYGPLMVAPLIALGFSFAFMREWRGSLIAPMTAHFIHNFTLMSIMIIFVQLIKDPII